MGSTSSPNSDKPRVKLEHFWLVKQYISNGEPFTFFWGVTAIGWEDAFRQVSRSPENVQVTIPMFMRWNEGDRDCLLVCRNDCPESETAKFSVRDDRIAKPVPKQLTFL